MKFVDILRQYNWPVAPDSHEHKRPGWEQFDCPFCRARHHYRMGYNLSFKYVNCWSCGHHPLLKTLMEITGLPYGKVKDLAGGLPAERAAVIPRGRLVLPKGLGQLLPAHERYLKGRGFDPDALVKLWGLQGIGQASRLAWRVFIPFYHEGEVVSWTTRSIAELVGKLRYVSARPSEEILPAKQELLYGEDYVRHAVVVCEGPFDVWRIGPGAVATLGTGFSRAQVARLHKYPIRVVCFDAEPTAQERARSLASELEAFPGTTYNVRLDAKDAAEASDREIRQLRKLIGG